METRESIAQKLRQLRLDRSLSQQQIASALGVTKITVSRWERAQAEPSIETFQRLCKLLNVHVSDFFDNEDTNPTLFERRLCARAKALNAQGQEVLLDNLETMISSGRWSKTSHNTSEEEE